MISCLKGILLETGMDAVVLDVNGIGFEVIIHQRALPHLPPRGDLLFLHTHLQVLENEFKLYGFLYREELKLFKKLLSVSGMGAKGALNVLAFMDPAGFYAAITSSDEKLLTRIPGIGKKSAQRLIFELREKVGDIEPISAEAAGDSTEQVIEALEALGYLRSEVFPLLVELKKSGQMGDRVEENVKIVLKMKARQMK